MSSLVSTQNLVEAPFIIAKIGKYVFGHCQRTRINEFANKLNLYPNFMESLNITKVNGAINTYTLSMVYAITEQDDPNYLEKVFSSISNSRTIYLTYGDWNAPEYIYKEEQALIKKLSTKVNLQQSSITYTLECVSTSVALTAASFPFAAQKAKPSDVLKDLLSNQNYGLTNIFKGMKNMSDIDLASCIPGDDQKVQLEAKECTILDYISYVVACMVHVQDDPSSNLKKSCYFWSTYDDTSNKYGGSYFKVVRVAANTCTQISYNTYEIDVGHPTAEFVTDFTVNNDDSWALLYNYVEESALPTSAYVIDNKGNVVTTPTSPALISRRTLTPNEASKNWWSLMTQFPITATLTIKGLLRPAILMSYVKVNTYFYGHKHTSSGLYIITKQQDLINDSGYRTTLSLTRIGGDEYYV